MATPTARGARSRRSEGLTETEAAGALAALFAGFAGAPTPAVVTAALAEIPAVLVGSLTPPMIASVASLLTSAPAPPLGVGPAASEQALTELVLRGYYALNLMRRVGVADQPEVALVGEERYFLMHLDASGRRMMAAGAVDLAAYRYGPEGSLGWWAVLDEVTTPECRRAHGNNFRVDRPPRIGYPGTLHGGRCRCTPGPRHRRGRLLT